MKLLMIVFDLNTKFSSDNAEALRDLGQITQATSANSNPLDSDGDLLDDEEADYAELTEYVRIVALTFYAEYAEDNTGGAEQNPNNLH